MPKREVSKQLAQRMPNGTMAVLLYQNRGDSFMAHFEKIFITNTTGSSVNYSLWVNQNGSQAVDQFCLYRSVALAANTTVLIEPGIILRGSSAAVLCASSTANALTFTCYGTEVEET